MQKNIEHLLSKIPSKPGVYKMKNQEGEIIYIGKAKDLSKRVKSYFSNTKNHSPKTLKLVENIHDIDYTEVHTELEALILETNLIKEFRPKYNILMKDDKNFSYIKITLNEDYPRILSVRKIAKDGAKYFGPKTASSRIYETLKILRKIFPFRNCNLSINTIAVGNSPDQKQLVQVKNASIKYPCLDLHINRCVGPCIGKPSQSEYQEIIQQIISFLEGKYDQIIQILTTEMQSAAKERNYEKAARIRDKISSIKNIFEKQNISSTDYQNADAVNFYQEKEKFYFNIFQIREGKIIDQQNITLIDEQSQEKEKQSEIIFRFLQQFYSENTDIPKEIILPEKPENESTVQQWLNDLSNHKVKFTVPQKGKKDNLLDLSLENAKSYAHQSKTRWEANIKPVREQGLENLAQLLSLTKIPSRIECYDISHLSGTNTVASMSVFEKGLPKNEHYRHFKISIENAGSPDDFKSIQEVILRRLKYIKPEKNYQGYKITKKKSDNKLQLVIKKDKEIITEIKIIQESKLKTFLSPFKTKQTELEPVIQKLLSKINSKRIYLIIGKSEQNLYEKFGFQSVRDLKEKIKLRRNEMIMVYDKTRNFQDNSFKQIPDLIVIDGGKGQLSSAIKSMQDFKIEIPIISLAKKREEIFIPGKTEAIQLEEGNPTRLLLQHLRDEAHRFAIEYNRKLRQNDYTSSTLEEIEGLGKILSKKLLIKFGSTNRISTATEDEIAEITGRKLAIKLKNFFK